MKLTGYDLSRDWFDFCYENPEKICPSHTALYFFAIEHCNRLGWKPKFGLPTEMTKEAIGIKSTHTYIKIFNDLVEFGFFKLIEKSKNQYSSNIIALSKNDKALYKALDKAQTKHYTKHEQSTIQSNDTINKLLNIEHINIELINNNIDLISLNLEKWILQELEENSNPILRRPKIEEFVDFFKSNGYTELSAENAWHYYVENNWKDKSGKQVKNWKIKVRNNWFKPYNKSEEETKPQQQKPKELPISKLLRRDFETNAKYLLEIKRRGEFPDIFDFSLSQDLREGKSEETILIEEHEMKLKHPKGLNYEGF